MTDAEMRKLTAQALVYLDSVLGNEEDICPAKMNRIRSRVGDVLLEELRKPSFYCAFCGAPGMSVREASEAGWSPGFFMGDNQHCAPICRDCENKHCEEGSDFEMHVKPGHERFLNWGVKGDWD